jgi:hypothetical protein
MFAQITDQYGVAINIIQVSGSIDDGVQDVIEGIWEGQSGSYIVTVFLCDGSPHPLVISESFTEFLIVNGPSSEVGC